jgi:hypothetical protein
VSRHEEFPELAPEAWAAVDAGYKAGRPLDSVKGDRRRLAAFLREAMKQAQAAGIGGSAWQELLAIANNLHNPPPPPPTLAQAREAARQLGGENAAVVHAFLATLGEGEP